MVSREGMLALVSALCVLTSASAYGAGEFEAHFRKAYADSFKQAFITAGGNEEEASWRAEAAADCFMKSVMQEFRFDEVARLDAWATNGKSPGQDVEQRLRRRMMDTVLRDACSSSASTTPAP